MGKILHLDNGTPLLYEKITHINSFSMGIYVKTGAIDEKENESGISHFIEHMLFKGTEKRSAKDISEEIDNIGGKMNAYTSKDTTTFYITALSEHFKTATDVLADIFLNSTFTEENIEKEKKVVIEEIRMYEDIPEEKIHDINNEYIFIGNYGKNILGTEDSINSLTREMVLDYYKDRYTSDNIAIVVVGNLSEEEVLTTFNTYFKNFTTAKRDRIKKPEFKLNTVKNVLKKEISQVHLCVNTLGSSYASEDRYINSILSIILGGNMSSRFFQKIREEKGLAYSVYTFNTSFYEGGAFSVYAGTTKENYNEVINMIYEEWKDIKENGVTEKELIKAQNQVLSSLILGLETTRARMSRLASSYITYNKIIPLKEIENKIKSIDREAVKKYANKIFDEKYYSVTILGDVNE